MVKLEEVSEAVSAWDLGRCILDCKLAELLVHPGIEVSNQRVCPESVEPLHVIWHLSWVGGLTLFECSGTYIDVVLSELVTRDLSDCAIQSPVCGRGGLLSNRSLLGPVLQSVCDELVLKGAVCTYVFGTSAPVCTPLVSATL